jgi:hypothetical protein
MENCFQHIGENYKKDFTSFESWKEPKINWTEMTREYGSIVGFCWDEKSDYFCVHCKENQLGVRNSRKCECCDVLSVNMSFSHSLIIKVSKDDHNEIVNFLIKCLDYITLLDIRFSN